MTQQTLGWTFGVEKGNFLRLLAFTGICKDFTRSVWEINKISLGLMTGNSPRGKLFNFQNRWGSNIYPGKKLTTIVICHLYVICKVRGWSSTGRGDRFVEKLLGVYIFFPSASSITHITALVQALTNTKNSAFTPPTTPVILPHTPYYYYYVKLISGLTIKWTIMVTGAASVSFASDSTSTNLFMRGVNIYGHGIMIFLVFIFLVGEVKLKGYS